MFSLNSNLQLYVLDIDITSVAVSKTDVIPGEVIKLTCDANAWPQVTHYRFKYGDDVPVEGWKQSNEVYIRAKIDMNRAQFTCEAYNRYITNSARYHKSEIMQVEG